MKEIIIGQINFEHIGGTPIERFSKAIETSKKEDYTVYTNDPLVIEALEVLNGSENIKIKYKKKNGETVEIDFSEAYSYCGDIYRMINQVRFVRDLYEYSFDREFKVDYEDLKDMINEYYEKHKIVEKD